MDLTNDGFLDNGDIIAVVSAILPVDIAADVNGDGIVDNGDIQPFIVIFLAGC